MRKACLSRFEAIRGTLEERLSAIDGEEAALKEKAEKLHAEHAQAQAQFDAVKSARTACEAERAAAIASLNETNQRLREAREAVRAMEQQMEAGKFPPEGVGGNEACARGLLRERAQRTP